MMSRSVIVAAVRTPFGKLGGGLAKLPATELGAIAIRAALERSGVDPAEVGYVVMGQVLQAGAGQAPARQAAIGAGIPKEVPADTINKVCASSIRAIELADLMVRTGQHDVVVTGGMESMSNAPYLLPKARFGYRLGNGEVLDHMVFDGLTSTFDGDHMVVQASRVARELGITREEQDAWAARSQARAAAAQDAGRLADEIVPVGELDARRGDPARHDRREARSAGARLRPRGNDDGRERPGVNDGASCVVVCSEEYADAHGLEVLATIVGQAAVADDFAYLARTPARAGALALEQAGRATADVARVEINEAFASVASNSTKLLGVDEEIVNVNGGAVALGSSDRRVRRQDRRRRSCTSSAARVAASAWRRSAPVAGRATRCWSRSDVGLRRSVQLGLVALAALAFTGAAHAYTCPTDAAPAAHRRCGRCVRRTLDGIHLGPRRRRPATALPLRGRPGGEGRPRARRSACGSRSSR